MKIRTGEFNIGDMVRIDCYGIFYYAKVVDFPRLKHRYITVTQDNISTTTFTSEYIKSIQIRHLTNEEKLELL